MSNKKNLLIPLFIFFLLAAGCNDEKGKKGKAELTKHTTSPAKIVPVFQGKIVYEATVIAQEQHDEKLFYDFSPSKVTIWFSVDTFRMIEQGGLSKGNILLHAATQKVWQLDTTANVAYSGVYSDMDNASDIVKEQMPDHFTPTVDTLDETEIVAGYLCRKYKVLRSGFLRSESENYFWATDAFQFPHARYDIQTDINRVIAPVPLTIGFKGGAILKMQIDDNGLVVTYTVTEIDTSAIPHSVFAIPENYVIR
jgi:hypothetical protein